MSLDSVAYLASKGLRGRPASGGREMVYPCFMYCSEPADSRKRKWYLNVEEGFWNCKVCNAAGGSYTLQRHFGDDPRAGTTDDTFTRRQILDWAADVGAQMLANRDDVLIHLFTERGLSPETITERQLGFVADGWSLTGSLPDRFSRDQLLQTGLVWKDGPRKGNDYFYRHLLIPVMHHGHVVQIRGRIWGEARGAKYMSGPGEPVRAFNIDSLDGADEVILTEGEMDCFSNDTEVLTPAGWVTFEDYQPGTPVVQYEEDGLLRLVAPLAFATKMAERTLRIYTIKRGGVDLRVTPGHRMVSTLAGGKGLRIHLASERPSGKYHVPRVGVLDGPGVEYSDDEIRLLLAIAADATIDLRKVDGAQYVRFGFKRLRKIERLVGLLQTLGIEHSASVLQSGYHSICFRIPAYLHAFKRLPHDWITRASGAQRELILEEMVHWDGNNVVSRSQDEFNSSCDADVVWMQAMAHTCGRVATIQRRSNKFGAWFKVSILHEKRSTCWQAIKVEEAGPAQVSCVQVPSGMLLVRRNGETAISGNCMVLAQHLAASTEDRARRMAVVGLPGTSAYPEELDDYLTDVRRIFIGFDSDEPGRLAADRLRDKYGARARVLQLPNIDGRKADWGEFLLPVQDRRGFEHEHPYAGHDATDVLRLMSEAAGKRIHSVAEAGAAFRAYRATHTGLRTGWTQLDAVIAPGLLPGQIVFLLARTGAGKTVILCNLAYQMRRHGILFVSLEMTREEIYHRLQRIYWHYHPTASIQELEYAFSKVWICDENRLGEKDLQALVNEYAMENGVNPEVVFVDYLGYYARGARGSSPYEKTTNAAMQLKADAKAGRLVIISPAQVNRIAKDGKPIDLDEARDSGAVGETGDFVLAAYRPDDALNEGIVNVPPTYRVKLSVLKSRHGGVGKVISLQMDALTLAIAEEGTRAAKIAEEHNILMRRGLTWDALRAREVAPRQMTMPGTAS